MCRPSKIDGRCVDLRRSMVDVSTFEDRWSMCRPSKIDGRCVDLRRSMADVSTFEDRWSICRPSKIDGRCVDLRRSMVEESTFEDRGLTTIIVVLILQGYTSNFEGRHPDHRSSKVDTSTNDLRRSTHRQSIFPFDHPLPSIIDLRRSTHRSPKVDTSNFESRHIDFEGRHRDLRRPKVETSQRQPNIAPTIRHRILFTTALHSGLPGYGSDPDRPATGLPVKGIDLDSIRIQIQVPMRTTGERGFSLRPNISVP